jgi:hypothetical protein
MLDIAYTQTQIHRSIINYEGGEFNMGQKILKDNFVDYFLVFEICEIFHNTVIYKKFV